MNSTDLLIKNRYCADHFNRDEYPMLFDRVRSDIEEFLSRTDASEFPSCIGEILDEVESNAGRFRFKFRRESAITDDKIVLSLFVVPAAAKIATPEATLFAESMASAWEDRFEGSVFKVGDYDEIMEGFKWKLTLTARN